MSKALAAVSLLVREYDEAIEFFTRALRFTLVEDTALGGDKRWVVVSPGHGGANLLLARAATEEQRACIGNQTGGRVCFFLHTSDFHADCEHMKAHGVQFLESPRDESFGQVVVFKDLYGNKWDLIQPR
jgi:catechol 2,3-dioxygenase-like lactoylglutathione lyase family enzyme